MATEQSNWSTAFAPASGWIGAFEQMMRLPFQMFSLGMDMFSQALRAVQPTASGGPTSGPTSNPSSARTGSTNPALSESVNRDESEPNPGTPLAAALNKPKETVMSCCDTNLSDDMLKLVQYSIVCIERDREKVLLCNECRVFSDNMTDCDFDSWVIADYVQSHDRIPCDKKYLRVSFQVLGRWPKQDLRYEEKELRRLKGIEHAIRDLKPREEVGQIAAGS